MQDCISKNLIFFNEDELLLISDFLKTLFQKKEFSLIRKLLLLWHENTSHSPLEPDVKQQPALVNNRRRESAGLAATNKINKITKYVEENYRRQITVSEVAGMVGLSENAFSRFFKKCTGLCFITYVNEVRIKAASLLLHETEDSVAGIAYTTGFNTPHYFNGVFKRNMGMTPGEYRVRRINLNVE